MLRLAETDRRHRSRIRRASASLAAVLALAGSATGCTGSQGGTTPGTAETSRGTGTPSVSGATAASPGGDGVATQNPTTPGGSGASDDTSAPPAGGSSATGSSTGASSAGAVTASSGAPSIPTAAALTATLLRLGGSSKWQRIVVTRAGSQLVVSGIVDRAGVSTPVSTSAPSAASARGVVPVALPARSVDTATIVRQLAAVPSGCSRATVDWTPTPGGAQGIWAHCAGSSGAARDPQATQLGQESFPTQPVANQAALAQTLQWARAWFGGSDATLNGVTWDVTAGTLTVQAPIGEGARRCAARATFGASTSPVLWTCTALGSAGLFRLDSVTPSAMTAARRNAMRAGSSGVSVQARTWHDGHTYYVVNSGDRLADETGTLLE